MIHIMSETVQPTQTITYRDEDFAPDNTPTMEIEIQSLRKMQDVDRYVLEDPENAIVHGGASMYGCIQERNRLVTGSDSTFPPSKLEYLNCSRENRYTVKGSKQYDQCESESSGYNQGANYSSVKQCDNASTYSYHERKLYKNELKVTEVIKRNTWYPDLSEINEGSTEWNEVMKYMKIHLI